MTEFSSPSITNLAKALLSAQEQLRPVAKDATNDFLRSRYVTLASVLEAVRAPLLANGLLIVQRPVESEPGTAAVETRIIHNSGEWISGTVCIALPDSDPGSKVNMGQAYGSALSYGRRYGLMAMLSIAATEDDSDCELRVQPQPQYRHFQPPQRVQQRTEQPAPQQAPAASGTARANYPGLPQIPDITYEDSKDIDGRNIVIARGKTLEHKESLKRSGFRWDSTKRNWFINAA